MMKTNNSLEKHALTKNNYFDMPYILQNVKGIKKKKSDHLIRFWKVSQADNFSAPPYT